jgi:hypothetical protein
MQTDAAFISISRDKLIEGFTFFEVRSFCFEYSTWFKVPSNLNDRSRVHPGLEHDSGPVGN